MFHSIAAVESELNRLDASQAVLCGLTGITPGSLSDILRGVKPASFQQEQDIYKWLEGLAKLIEAVKPLQLDLRKTLQIKEQIQLLESGRLQILIAVQEARPINEPYYYVFLQNSYNYFRARRRNPLNKFEIVPASGAGTAAAMDLQVAEQVKTALAEVGIKASVVRGSNISEDVMIYDNFEEIWGEPEQEPRS